MTAGYQGQNTKTCGYLYFPFYSLRIFEIIWKTNPPSSKCRESYRLCIEFSKIFGFAEESIFLLLDLCATWMLDCYDAAPSVRDKRRDWTSRVSLCMQCAHTTSRPTHWSLKGCWTLMLHWFQDSSTRDTTWRAYIRRAASSYWPYVWYWSNRWSNPLRYRLVDHLGCK